MDEGEETCILIKDKENSIIQGFSGFSSNEKPVIEPLDSKRDKILHSKGIVIAFTPRPLMKLKRELGHVEPVKLSGWLFKSYMAMYRGKEVVTAFPFPGSPSAVAALEVLKLWAEKYLWL